VTKAERLAALKPHLDKATRAYHQALDEACRETTPDAFHKLSDSVARYQQLDRLKQDVEASADWDRA